MTISRIHNGGAPSFVLSSRTTLANSQRALRALSCHRQPAPALVVNGSKHRELKFGYEQQSNGDGVERPRLSLALLPDERRRDDCA